MLHTKAPHQSHVVGQSLDRFSEAYSALSKVWTTAHTQVQKGKGGIHFICDKITVIH